MEEILDVALYFERRSPRFELNSEKVPNWLARRQLRDARYRQLGLPLDPVRRMVTTARFQ
jgi:hypothetical protein